MKKVLIADDEYRVCLLLKCLIHWSELSMECVGTAHDGLELQAMIRENGPDIVVTDIRMPEVDGLEVIENLRREGYQGDFIVISGYQQFEYARKAMKYGVDHYLLKPVQEKELNEALLDISRKLEGETERKLREEEMKSSLSDSQNLMRKQIIAALIEENSGMDIKKENMRRELVFPYSRFILLGIHLGFAKDLETKYHTHIVELAIEEMAAVIPTEQYEYSTYQVENRIFFLLNFDGEDIHKGLVRNMISTLRSFFIKYGTPHCGLSGVYEMVDPKMYEEVQQTLLCRWENKDRTFFTVDDLRNIGTGTVDANALARVKKYFEILDEKSMRQYFNEYMQLSAWNRIPPYSVFCDMLKIYAAFESIVQTRYQEYADILNMKYYRKEILNESSSLACIKKSEEIICGQMMELLEKQSMVEILYVREAKRYIAEHFSKEISLETISSELKISPNYFSTLFKQDTGETFKEYLTSYRLEQSKKLLEQTTLSIAEISERVGYNDEHYFSKIFKKNVGIKPTQYRKLHISI